jgi:Ca-activated chloride channel family protein
MARVRFVHYFVLSLILATALRVLAQSPAAINKGSARSPQIAVDMPSGRASTRTVAVRMSVDLVLIPVTVTDALNHPQTNLTRSDFKIYEGDRPEEIRYFSQEDSPISVGLLLDVSKSMQDKIDTERAAVDQFFRNANPQDDYFVITFNGRPRVLSDVTQSTNGIETELGLVEPSGPTALLDAVYLGISKLHNAKYSRRALVIISDGGDNSSRYKFREIKSIAAESDVMLYAIGIFDSTPFKSFEETMGRRWLSAMTDVTGGRTSTVKSTAKLPEQCALLSRELRSQYLLGYEPRDRKSDGKWHKIKVVVSGSSESGQLHSYYRKGYFTPNP